MSSVLVGEHFTVPGGKVHLLRRGAGRPLLFLHAAGGAGAWSEFLELLSGHFDVIAPDHPGFGKSDDLPEIDDMTDLVYHYVDLMDQLGLNRPHLVGGSFGGWIAAEIAVAFPERISSLSLLGAVGLRLPEHPVADLFLMTPPELAAALFHDPEKAAAFFPAEPDIDTILAGYRDMAGLARFSWRPFMSNPKLERRLGRITVPTQVVWAADDAVVPIAHGRRYAERIPGARYSVIENCGHAMYFERPAEWSAIVTAFATSAASTRHGKGVS